MIIARSPKPTTGKEYFLQERARKVGEALAGLRHRFAEEEAQHRAKSLGIPYMNLVGFPIDPDPLSRLRREDAAAARVIPFFEEGEQLKVGVVDPHSPLIEKIMNQFKQQGKNVKVYLISQDSFQHGLASYARIKQETTKEGTGEISITQREVNSYRKKVGELSHLQQEALKSTPSELLRTMLLAALAVDASDVHLEPQRDDVRVRLRLDGVLHDAYRLPYHAYQYLLSRIKMIGRIKLNVHTPQDGHFAILLDAKEVDVRVSVLPSSFGDAVVLRILRFEGAKLRIEDLGLHSSVLTLVQDQLHRPAGLVVTSGPTGSGKTTTMYTFLQHLNEPGVKIITIEDPVEYRIPGIEQINVDEDRKVSFASALRSVLRQDPDIILVGEMRDRETSVTAAQASLTGHMVLSTVHTNDAASVPTRLLDLGVERIDVAAALRLAMSQRLVRVLCGNCKEKTQPEKTLLERARHALASIPPQSGIKIPREPEFFRSRGCSACAGLSYKGRVGIFEAFTVTEEIAKLISAGASSRELRKEAIHEGMLTMAQDGVLKALSGITDLEEVFRVTEE